MMARRVCVCVCTCVHMCVYARVCTLYMHTYVCICVFVCVCACACIHVYVCLYVYPRVHRYVYVYAHACMSMCTCVHTCRTARTNISVMQLIITPLQFNEQFVKSVFNMSGKLRSVHHKYLEYITVLLYIMYCSHIVFLNNNYMHVLMHMYLCAFRNKASMY